MSLIFDNSLFDLLGAPSRDVDPKFVSFSIIFGRIVLLSLMRRTMTFKTHYHDSCYNSCNYDCANYAKDG